MAGGSISTVGRIISTVRRSWQGHIHSQEEHIHRSISTIGGPCRGISTVGRSVSIGAYPSQEVLVGAYPWLGGYLICLQHTHILNNISVNNQYNQKKKNLITQKETLIKIVQKGIFVSKTIKFSKFSDINCYISKFNFNEAKRRKNMINQVV